MLQCYERAQLAGGRHRAARVRRARQVLQERLPGQGVVKPRHVGQKQPQLRGHAGAGVSQERLQRRQARVRLLVI